MSLSLEPAHHPVSQRSRRFRHGIGFLFFSTLSKSVTETLRRIKALLYPNYLANAPGAYIVRTKNDASLSIEDVCAALKNRGGFTGNYNDLVEYVKRFFDETAYQLCDGFAVNTGYFSIRSNADGLFDKAGDIHDANKHPVSFRFRARAPLRARASRVVVEIEGLADVNGYIDEFVDVATGAVNETATPGGQFSVAGHKIKVAGDKPETGVYFVSADGAGLRVKVSGHLAENAANKLIGVIPALNAGTWTVEVVTQYTTGSAFLKEPRVLEFAGELTVNSNTE
ncbi:MAG: DUF4469 domain-containing protein [Treponema sp.]|nr:DUF4469 domain-containing protein [Treponema sp.]